MSKYLRWFPAMLVMVVIFIFSSTPSTDLPSYGIGDTIIKKGSHMIGYALLSISYWYGFGFNPKKIWLSWVLAFLYAVSDEVHQSFTPGRTPSPLDVLVFDGGGAVIGLSLIKTMLIKRDQVLNHK